MGTIIVRNGEVVSQGWAHVGISLQTMFCVHSEIHALLRARHIDLEGCIAYTVGLRSGTARRVRAAPCVACALALRNAGITTVICSADNKQIEEVFITDDLLDTLKEYARPDANHRSGSSPR